MARKRKQPLAARSATLTEMVEPSKPIVVASAIANQLHQEGRWPPNDATKVMGSDYHYTALTLDSFLIAVQWHLAHGRPPFTFTYDHAFVVRAIAMDIATLMASVDTLTT
jgi:hypothetical protein